MDVASNNGAIKNNYQHAIGIAVPENKVKGDTVVVVRWVFQEPERLHSVGCGCKQSTQAVSITDKRHYGTRTRELTPRPHARTQAHASTHTPTHKQTHAHAPKHPRTQAPTSTHAPNLGVVLEEKADGFELDQKACGGISRGGQLRKQVQRLEDDLLALGPPGQVGPAAKQSKRPEEKGTKGGGVR